MAQQHRKKTILVILSSHDQLGDTGKKTGYYLPELAHPYYELEPHYDLVSATPKGGVAPLDPGSAEAYAKDPECQKFLADPKAQLLVQNTKKLSEVHAKDFDAVFYPGGHGPVFDLPQNADSQKLAAQVYEKGGVVAAVCHGPAAIVHTKLSNGKNLVEHKKATGFSNEEEEAVKLTKAVPFLLEDELKKSGAEYVKAPKPWDPCVVVTERLVTGQNPASARPLGQEVHKLLREAK